MMKHLFLIYFLSIVTTACSQNTGNSTSDSADIFAGTTPCGNIIRPLHKIKKEGNCALEECKCVMVEWRLELHKDPVTKEPAGYKLTSINRFTVAETNMLSQPGTKTESEGKWAIIKGNQQKPGAILYRLNADKKDLSLDLIKLDNDLLHVLDDEGKLMIGNEFWSYTLTRLK
jgi:hypothetical protein